MYKRNAGANNNQLLTIYQGVHITLVPLHKFSFIEVEIYTEKFQKNFLQIGRARASTADSKHQSFNGKHIPHAKLRT